LGCSLEKLEKEWTEYPVLHFDMSTAKHADCEQLLQELNMKLIRYEEVYGKMEGEFIELQMVEFTDKAKFIEHPMVMFTEMVF
jgi:hypothetical protein